MTLHTKRLVIFQLARVACSRIPVYKWTSLQCQSLPGPSLISTSCDQFKPLTGNARMFSIKPGHWFSATDLQICPCFLSHFHSCLRHPIYCTNLWQSIKVTEHSALLKAVKIRLQSSGAFAVITTKSLVVNMFCSWLFFVHSDATCKP